MKKFILILPILLVCFSCSDKKEQKAFEYYEFKKQITPSGKFAIYKYARYGAMAFSSDISGTEVIPITEEFKEGNGKSIDGTISHWINNDTLLVYDFKSELKQPKDTLPIKTTYEQAGDFTIKKINYKTNSGGTNRYTFDSVWTKNDRIYVKFNYSDTKKNVRSFPLGAVYIRTKADTIQLVEIFGGLSKRMNFVYKNPDGTFQNNLPGIGTTFYEYKPTKRIFINDLNQKKIFYGE